MKNFFILLRAYKVGPFLMEDMDIVSLINRLDNMNKKLDAIASLQFTAFDGAYPFSAFVAFDLKEYVGYYIDHK